MNITVSGSAYFEALDHLGTNAAREGVPEPTRLVRLSKGHRAIYEHPTAAQIAAILDRLDAAGNPGWIGMLRSEGARENADEIRAALACQRAALKIRHQLTTTDTGAV